MAQQRKDLLPTKIIFILITVCALLPFRLAVDSILIGVVILAVIIIAEISELFNN